MFFGKRSGFSAVLPFITMPRRIGLVLTLTLAGLLFTSGTLARADGPVSPGRYVPPASNFIIDPAETIIRLNFGRAHLADIQSQLDAARAANPDAPIVLTLT